MRYLNFSDYRPGPRALAAVLALYVLGSVVPMSRARADDVGDPVAGRKLATAWCSNCHALADAKQATATGAPSFSAVAADRSVTALSLRAFLQTPHQRMPDLHLSNNETDDLISYILSVRGR
jgi:mono/diheme cytochrome c family protein